MSNSSSQSSIAPHKCKPFNRGLESKVHKGKRLRKSIKSYGKSVSITISGQTNITDRESSNVLYVRQRSRGLARYIKNNCLGKILLFAVFRVVDEDPNRHAPVGERVQGDVVRHNIATTMWQAREFGQDGS